MMTRPHRFHRGLSDERIALLLRSIYEAALEPPKWRDVLVELRDVFRGNSAKIAKIDFESGEATLLEVLDIETHVLHRWLAEHAQHDIWAAAAVQYFMPESGGDGTATGGQLVPVDSLRHSPLYRDILTCLDVVDTVSLCLETPTQVISYLGVYRSHETGLYDARDLELMKWVAPHIRRAFDIQRRLADERRVTESVMAAHSLAVFVCGGDGSILRHNAYGEQLLRVADGLRASNGRLGACQRDEHEVLAEAIRRAGELAAGTGRNGGATLSIRRPSLRRPLGVYVFPAAPDRGLRALSYGIESPCVVVVVGDPEIQPEPSEAVLARLYGLTRAEGRVAAALVRGLSVKECAEALGSGIETVRFHLKSILSKTGTHRQSELVRLLIGGVAALACHEEDESPRAARGR